MFCLRGQEHLCDAPAFTGYTRPGGYATHVLVDARYAVALPAEGDDVADAPLLCTGLIGWRSLVKAGDGGRIGLYGFGAAATSSCSSCARKGARLMTRIAS